MAKLISDRESQGVAEESRMQAAELLAGYLLASPRFRCPGVDGPTIEDVVAAEYPAASAAGWVPQPVALGVRHPELAEAIASFFVAGAVHAVMAC